MNVNVLRGWALIAIGWLFGIPSIGYRIGTLDHAGPGLFPLMVACVVGIIGVILLVQARFEAPVRSEFNARNIAVIIASLVGFALVADHVGAVPAIVLLVFISAFAGEGYSVVRNLKISAGLIVIAALLHYGLGLNMPLLGR